MRLKLENSKEQWQNDAFEQAGLSSALLPHIQDSGSIAGTTTRAAAARFGLPAGVAVATAIGDNQASILASTRGYKPDDVLALTLGTGGQLSAVMPADFTPKSIRGKTFEYRPFPSRRFAAVAALLAGKAGQSSEQWH